MQLMKKVLPYFFGFISIVLLIEIIFYGFFLKTENNRLKSVCNNLNAEKTNVQTAIPTVSQAPVTNALHAFDERTLKNVNYFIGIKAITQSKLINRYQGKILSLSLDDWENKYKNYHPVFAITLKTSSNSAKNLVYLLFDKDEIKNLTVKDSKDKTLDYQALKVGQTVTVEETYDVIKKATTNYLATINTE